MLHTILGLDRGESTCSGILVSANRESKHGSRFQITAEYHQQTC